MRLKKNLQNSTLPFIQEKGGGGGEPQKTINFCDKLSFTLTLLLPERLHCCFTMFSLLLPVRTATIITFEPCALNAEFLHFIPRLALLYGDH